MPDFTIEHLAATLAVTRRRERARCVAVLVAVNEEIGGDDPGLEEAIKRLTLSADPPRLETGPLTPEESVPDEEVTHTADGLPPDVHLDDFVEGTHLARRHGQF